MTAHAKRWRCRACSRSRISDRRRWDGAAKPVARGPGAFGRFRGNPRGKAIETLGQYGPKAIAAVPVLEAILVSDAKNDKLLQKTAQLAIASIRGEPSH